MKRHGRCVRWYLVVLTAFILILLPSGCGDQPPSGPQNHSTETGSIALNIQWYTDRETAGTQPMQADYLDCEGEGVATVTVQVYDENSQWLKNEDWPCTDHGGTITGILAGDDRRFVALAEDAGGNTLLRGERTGISIVAGRTTPAVDIPAHWFVTELNAPADEADVELNDFSLEWEAVENAEQYRVLVATDDTFDDDQIVINTTTAETTFAPTGLAPSTRYYWRVHVLDTQQNESAAPEYRSFTTSAVSNQRPTADITRPSNNDSFNLGETITFTGSALDPEEGPLTDSALVWISNLDGSIGSGTTFTRNDLSLGTHTITLTATDSQGASGSATVRISILSPSNCHPPVLDPIGNQEVDEGDQLTFSVSASDPDPNDQLTFSAGGLPSGADFDPDTGQFNWLTTSGDQGNYTVTFEVCDNCPDEPLCDDEQVIISVGDVCRPPELDAIGDRNVIEGQALSFTVSASDPDAGNQLTFRADLSNLPDEADAAFDRDTGEFSWNTASGEAGDYLVTFEVCDDCPDGPLCDDEQITITVGACSYTIDPEEEDFPRAGGQGTIEVTASDPSCEWSAAENVAWIEITSGGTGRGNGTVRYTVAANPGASRSTNIVVAGVTHSVSQEAADCTFTIDPPNRMNVPYGGETYTIAVDALREDCPWTASESVGWISIIPTGDTGDGTVRVTVSANNTDQTRTATIHIAGQSHTVNQELLTPQTGSLRVTIFPDAAVSAGARWRVDEGPWRTSGYTQSGLSVGDHTVAFNDIDDWTRPGNQTATIANNQTATASGTYTCSAPSVPGSIDYPSSDDDGSFAVDWPSVSGATRYRLQRATNASFTGATTVYTGSTASYNQTGLGTGTYYYRVRAENSCGNSSYRTGGAITVSLLPSTPSLISPNNNAVLDNSCYPTGTDELRWDFDWTDLASATRYELETDHPAPSQGGTVTVTESSYTMIGNSPLPNDYLNNWRWHVRACNSNGCGSWSGWRYFTVEPVDTDCPEPGPPVISGISEAYTGIQTCYRSDGTSFTGYHNFIYFNYSDPDGNASESEGAWVTVNSAEWQWSWINLQYGDGFSGRLRVSYCNSSPGHTVTIRMYDGDENESNPLSIDLTGPEP